MGTPSEVESIPSGAQSATMASRDKAGNEWVCATPCVMQSIEGAYGLSFEDAARLDHAYAMFSAMGEDLPADARLLLVKVCVAISLHVLKLAGEGEQVPVWFRTGRDLEDMIKSFAIRIGFEENVHSNRTIMSLVYARHRYVHAGFIHFVVSTDFMFPSKPNAISLPSSV
jgi:hypothetical protein